MILNSLHGSSVDIEHVVGLLVVMPRKVGTTNTLFTLTLVDIVVVVVA